MSSDLSERGHWHHMEPAGPWLPGWVLQPWTAPGDSS